MDKVESAPHGMEWLGQEQESIGRRETYRLSIVGDVQALVYPQHLVASRDGLGDGPNSQNRADGKSSQGQHLRATAQEGAHAVSQRGKEQTLKDRK